FLHCEHYTSRPAHADQLHLDLWWHGQNIAMDAGTYQYNAPQPWENGLAHTRVHNTVEVDGQDQMTRAGRFLWLDWAQGQEMPSPTANIQIAVHNGYTRLGVLHRRSVEQLPDQWRVLDELLPAGVARAHTAHLFRLHWLLPDWDWDLNGQTLCLKSAQGTTVEIALREGNNQPLEIQLIRAGKVLKGSQEKVPTLGWYSPTYGVNLPALSLRASLSAFAPVKLSTRIVLKA
ncbi:MAG TPA: heparinase II/III-family protein, partial [Anaerolineaceae bacterium]|nr:heparinase II/III-family protein [Anaerolineaceae bacterium]